MVQNWRKSNSSLCHLSLESPKRPTPNSKTFYGTSCPSRAAHLGSARSAARPSSVTASTARPSTALFTASRRYAATRPSAEKSKIDDFSVAGAARQAPARSGPLTVAGRTGAHVRRHEGLQGGGFQSQRGKTRERALRRAQGVGRGAHAARSRSILFLMSFGHEGLALAASAASECCT